MTERRVRQWFLLLFVAAISLAFVAMIRDFMLTILLAAILAGLSHPLYRWLFVHLDGRPALAALSTLLLLLVLVMAPLLGVLAAGANEALHVAQTVRPVVERLVDQPGELDARLRALPGYGFFEPYRAQILTTASDLLGSTSAFVFAALSATTRAGAVFVFQFVVLLYTMFYFLTGGPGLLRSVLSHVPLKEADTDRMVAQFMAVTRASMKGSLLIGAMQGAAGGVVFWLVGLDGAIFWGMVMAVVSMVPGVGAPLVWVPAAVFLLLTGQVGRAIALTVLCGLVVGSIDNLVRPRLVGRDTRMHDLLIFFSTMGGLLLFGAMGFILGPVIAALFVTAWDMFSREFQREGAGLH